MSVNLDAVEAAAYVHLKQQVDDLKQQLERALVEIWNLKFQVLEGKKRGIVLDNVLVGVCVGVVLGIVVTMLWK